MLLRKGFCSCEYMEKWKKVNETSLPEKYNFQNSLNIEEIPDLDYMYAKRICKEFVQNFQMNSISKS